MQSPYVIEFSGDSEPLLGSLFKAAHDTWNDFKFLERHGRVSLVSGKIEEIKELSFVNFISEFLGIINDPTDLRNIHIPDGKFYVRIADYDGNIEFTESQAGNLLSAQGRVSFSEPDFVIRIVKLSRIFIGKMVFQKDGSINQRRSALRPFFSPVSIHPKFARFAINLSRTHPGDTVLDPFCGTGGIIIEAGIMGRKIIGSDSSLAMVRGARLNLKYYGLSEDVRCAAFSDLELDQRVDAIVTDPPYGRSSELSGESVESMHRGLYKKAHELLKKDGILSIVVSDPEMLKFSANFFSVMSIDAVRIHRSLTRYFVSLRRIN